LRVHTGARSRTPGRAVEERVRLWKRRSAEAEERQAETPPNAGFEETRGGAPAAFRPITPHGGHVGGGDPPVPPAPGAASPATPSPAAPPQDYGHAPSRTVRGRLLRTDAAGTS